MAEKIIVQCSGCSAKLSLADASKLGKKIRCPKCTEVFVAQALKPAAAPKPAATKATSATKPVAAKTAKPAAKPAPAKKPAKKSDDDEFNFDDMDMEDQSDADDGDESEEMPVRSKSGGKKSAAKGKGKGKKTSGGLPLPLIIGGSVAVVLLLGVGAYFLFSGPKEEPVAAQPAPPPAAVPVAAAPVAQEESPNDRILALKWLPQDTELIVHLKIGDLWQAPLLKGFIDSPQAAGPVQQMQQMTGLVPADLESVTIGFRNFDQLQQAGAQMAFGGAPPTDSLGLIVIRSKKGVDVAQLQQTATQSVPNQMLKLADHNGKQFLELAVPDAPPAQGFGPPPGTGRPPVGFPPGAGGPPNGGFPGTPGPAAGAPAAGPAASGKSIGGWFADSNTLLIGLRDQLVAAMDRGESNAPRTEFRKVDASPHLLFVAAPKNLAQFTTPVSGAITAQAPGEAEFQKTLQENMRAISFGFSVTGGVGLQTSLVCADAGGAAKVKPELEKLVTLAKSQFEARNGTWPQFQVELVGMLVNNIQVTEQGSAVRVATNIPDSAQSQLEQLPAMLMGAALAGGLGRASPPSIVGGQPVNGPGDVVQQSHAKNQMKQIALAMHNHHDTYKTFPPSYTMDATGKPLLSWRVHLLPFLGEVELYKQFHLDEPWDSDHNRTLLTQMPKVFGAIDEQAEQNRSGLTRFVVPVGTGVAFEGTAGISIRDFVDGTANTILLVEVAADAAVEWTKPEDLPFVPDEPLRNLGGSRDGYFLVGLADGSVRAIKDSINPETLKKLFTRKGSEPIEDSF